MTEKNDPLFGEDHSVGREFPEVNCPSASLIDAPEGLQPTRALAVAASLDGLWRWDLQSDSLQYSDRCSELLGYGTGEIPKVIQDITDRKHAEKTLEERLRFERLLAELSATFVNLPCDQIEGVFDGSLKMLVQSLEIDRSTLAEFPEDNGHALLVTHSYCHGRAICRL